MCGGFLMPYSRTTAPTSPGTLRKLGYTTDWRLLNASDFGVPQLRPRVVFIAVRSSYSEHFYWPEPLQTPAPTVGDVLFDLISSRGWRGAKIWKARANEIAPTIVGGSKKTRRAGPWTNALETCVGPVLASMLTALWMSRRRRILLGCPA